MHGDGAGRWRRRNDGKRPARTLRNDPDYATFASEMKYVIPPSRSIPVLLALLLIGLTGCSSLMQWPEAPLYSFPESDPDRSRPQTVEEVMKAIEGRYAHFDVVSYEDMTTRRPMRTFIVSYGFTEFRIENGRLLQIDSFCHAEQILNQKGSEAVFSDAATRSIKPRVQEVEVSLKDGQWHVYRPPSPTLLGIAGDPSIPLSRDSNDPNLLDPDRDGHPGVTVTIRVGDYFEGEIYITRREIYSYFLVYHSDGNLYGHVDDESEQFVIDASRRIFRQESNMVQLADPGMSPVILIRVSRDLDTCEELMAVRDDLFPPEPAFY